MNKKAIVTGATGQDGSFLCELLLDKGYDVFGVSRSSTRKNDNLDFCCAYPKFKQINIDITDSSGVFNMVDSIQPDEYYNLAAMSHVGQSFKEPQSTLMIDGYAVTNALEAIRKFSPSCKFYQASTSELYGKVEFGECLNEESDFSPRSPYAAAKMYAHNMVKIYREGYGLHASCGILFNHESERRGENFVTRKLTKGIAAIKAGLRGKIHLGNLDAYRDWGYAKDYVEGMWMMLQQDDPDDYVLATNVSVSVKTALKYLCEKNDLLFDDVYKVNQEFMRPAEVPYLKGDYSKAKEKLGWEPKHLWMDVLDIMFEKDFKASMREVYMYR